MSKKVCVFVWNHFTNDARVLRECSALAEAGYEVDVIAIHNWKNEKLLKEEQHQHGFRVIRVNNRLRLLHDVLTVIKKIRKKWLELHLIFLIILNIFTNLKLITTGYGVAAYLGVVALSALLIAVFTKTKLPTVITRSYIFSQMVRHGRKKRYDFYHSNDLNTLMQGVLSSKVV